MEIDSGAESKVLIAPSILDSDLTRLGDTIAALEAAGADYVHLDVMDGQFVPNISIGVPVVASIRSVTTLPLDVHLMIDSPERYVETFIAAGANILSIHLEATRHPHRVLQSIREAGCRAGLALNPGTPIGAAVDLLPACDLVLIMSVNPGFGGQTFIPGTLVRIREARRLLDELHSDAMIEVDGGVSAANAADVVESGANVLVAGSAIFKSPAGVNSAIGDLRIAVSR